MSLYYCDLCKKGFKTNQHLMQHKNRKKICTNSPNIVDSSLVNTSTLLNNIELSSDDLIKFISTYKTIQDLIKDKDTITEYKQKISQLKKENTMLKHQLCLINKLIKNTTEIVSNDDICEQKDTAQTNNQNETDVYLSVPIDKCDENNEAI